ncbi:unnamed protein product [Mytilus coruscus]|uniref:CARD domain-containing protein n=1 Tax=Mytilus coruscus TaxID=42192 RepID=A0A6J8BDT3_MYTCO|nr:unnamed protein product [Mytilus coruscus]
MYKTTPSKIVFDRYWNNLKLSKDTEERLLKWWIMQSQCAIQQHFSFLKGSAGISVDEMNSIALDTTAFNQTEFEMVQNQRNSILKIDAFLKKLIRKGNIYCELFLRGLKRKGHARIVQVLSEEQNTNSAANPVVVDNRFTKAFIEQHLEYVCQNLQVSATLDMLFERNIITIDVHDCVQGLETKSRKRSELMRLLLERQETTWISSFINVLRLTGHDTMLDYLLNLTATSQISGYQQPTSIIIGNTRLVEPTNFVARLFTNDGFNNQLNVLQVTDTDAIQEALESGLIELWEGSIYLHLSSFSPSLILSILNGEADNKLQLFLVKFLQGNKKLLNYFEGQRILSFSIRELPNHEFLGSSDGKKQRNCRAITNTDMCLDCYRSTLRAQCNYKIVLDEIEDDIIDDTLKRVQHIRSIRQSVYVSKGCHLENKTRSEKAVNFMQYVLYNEDVLEEFQKVFSYRSEANLKQHKCQRCTMGYSSHVLTMPRERVFHFNVLLDDLGKVKVTDITNELQLPSVTLRPLIGIERKRNMLRAKSLIDIPACKDVEEYRIVVMGDTKCWNKCRTEFYKTAKGLYGKMFKFYELPSFRKKIIDEKDKKKIADCIARTSPGPHAFVMFTDSYNHAELQSTMDPYIKYFGPDIVQFLIPVFTTESNFIGYPVEMVEEFISSTVPLQNILKQCGGRYLVFNTYSEHESKCVQVKRLTKLIKQVRFQKAKEYYSSEIFEKSEKAVKKKTDIIKIETKNKIRRLEDELSLLKMENPREKAAKTLQSQKSFIDMVCVVVDDDDVVE